MANFRGFTNKYFVYKLLMNGTLALAMAETFGSGDFPQPSKIIKITFLFILLDFVYTNIKTKVLRLQDFKAYLL